MRTSQGLAEEEEDGEAGMRWERTEVSAEEWIESILDANQADRRGNLKLFSREDPFDGKACSLPWPAEMKTNLANQGLAHNLMVDCRFSSCAIALCLISDVAVKGSVE